MLIKRIEIRNFRKLARPVRLDGLQPGLNVIAGDNEEGKSTVLEAVRAALFDRHNLTGEGASSFQPFGSAVRPEVRLAFEVGGEEYHLAKSYCQNQSAELHTSDKAFNGPAAEERLRELLER